MARFDKLLVLDLDGTLLFSTEEPLGRDPDFRIRPYFTYLRPGVEAFLATCLAWFEVAVWSSATAAYVRDALDHLFPESSNLAFVWSRERCTFRRTPSEPGGCYLKDLAKLKRRGFALEKMIMIEDDPRACARNYGNAVLVTPYEGSPDDSELPRLLRYLEQIGAVPSIRAIDKRSWQTKALASGVSP